MKWLMHPLLEPDRQRDKYVEYLKVENQILRDRLPKKIETTEAERDKLLKSEGIKPVRIGPRWPNQNSIAERFVRTIKEECLSRFLVFGEDHLRYLVEQFVDYYHTKRTYHGLGYKTPRQAELGEEPGTVKMLCRPELVRRESLGGALKWHERKAA